MQVAKWGNSLAVRLPAKLVAELWLAEGDEIEIVKASRERLEIERKKSATERSRSCAGFAKYAVRFPAGFRVQALGRL